MTPFAMFDGGTRRAGEIGCQIARKVVRTARSHTTSS
jgi:hypothetical protein